jgi:hypothetical protein
MSKYTSHSPTTTELYFVTSTTDKSQTSSLCNLQTFHVTQIPQSEEYAKFWGFKKVTVQNQLHLQQLQDTLETQNTVNLC